MDSATYWLLEDSFLAKGKARSFLLQSYSNRFLWSQVTRHSWIAPGICYYKKGCVCWKRFAYLIEPSAWPWNPLNLQTAESVFGQEGLWGRAPFLVLQKSISPPPLPPIIRSKSSKSEIQPVWVATALCTPQIIPRKVLQFRLCDQGIKNNWSNFAIKYSKQLKLRKC